MAKKQKAVVGNPTYVKIKNSPFQSAKEIKDNENRIDREEWETITRAEARHGYLRRPDSSVGRLFTQGFKAEFKSDNEETEHAVWVHLSKEDEIKIEIDREFKSKDSNGTLEALVRSLSQSFISGYLMTIGLKNDEPVPLTGKKKND